MQVKFYKNVAKGNAEQGKNSSGAAVADGSVIFADDGKIYLKDTAGVTVYGAGSMPEAYKNYLDGQLSAQASAALSASVSLSTPSCVADKLPSSQTATLTVTFNGKAVDLDEVPAGWSTVSGKQGVYAKNLADVKGNTGSVSVQYTVQSGDYKGITVKKTVSGKQMGVSYPAWYGVSASKSADVAQSFIATAIRTESNVSDGDYTWANSLDVSAYGLILSRGASTASQAGISIISIVKTGVSVESNGVTLGGYTLYATDKSIAAKGSAQKVALSIRTA